MSLLTKHFIRQRAFVWRTLTGANFTESHHKSYFLENKTLSIRVKSGSHLPATFHPTLSKSLTIYPTYPATFYPTLTCIWRTLTGANFTKSHKPYFLEYKIASIRVKSVSPPCYADCQWHIFNVVWIVFMHYSVSTWYSSEHLQMINDHTSFPHFSHLIQQFYQLYWLYR